MPSKKTVEDYIAKHENYREELNVLRTVFLHNEMEETIKWGAPVYCIDGKNVAGMAAFKSYVGIWFFQGVFLEDGSKVLVNAQDGKTKALRQWRFNSVDEMDKKLIDAYVKEAIENQRQGKGLKPEKKVVEIPAELKNALKSDKVLKTEFDKLSPGKQKEYAEHIGSAKQEKTRLGRLEKAIPLILDGKGLYDKYKNC